MDNRKIRLLVVIDRYHPLLGGAQNNTRALLRNINQSLFQITVLTRRVGAELEEREEIDGIEVRRSGYSSIRVLSKISFFVSMIRYLVGNRHHYDMVFCVPCTQVTDFLPVFFASLVTGKPYLFRTTSEDSLDVMLKADLKSPPGIVKFLVSPPFLWRIAAQRAACLVNINHVLQEKALNYGFQHCQLIWHGTDTDRFRPADNEEKSSLRDSLGFAPERVVITCVSRYFATKNQIALLRAAAVLKERGYGDRISVLIIGATEENQMHSNETELRGFTAENDLEGIVTFFNDVRNVEDYLRASDILVFPSLYNEGMSNVILEAMACGLPIVSSNMPQVVCAFPDGEGIFFDGNDVETLVARLIELIQSEENRKSYGGTLAAHARESYSVTRAAREYEALFRRHLPKGSSV